MSLRNQKCVICYKKISSERNLKDKVSKNSFAYEGNFGTGEKCASLEQLPVICFVRLLLNIPEKMCQNFLQTSGNPISWIFWCDSCSKLVRETENLFQQIQKLEYRLNLLRMDIKNTIISSADKLENTSPKRRGISINTTLSPTEEIRSYIIKECENYNDAKEKVKIEPEEVNYYGESHSPGSCSFENFNEDDELNHTITLTNPAVKKSCQQYDDELGKFEDSHVSDRQMSETSNTKEDAEVSNSKVVAELKCTVCFRVYKSLDSLRRHYKSIHEKSASKSLNLDVKILKKPGLEEKNEKVVDVTRFFCEICKRSYSRLSELKRHCRNNHNDTEPVAAVKVTKEKIWDCEKCGKVYQCLGNLKKHRASVHEPCAQDNKFCSICPRKFIKSCSLKFHYLQKHVEEFENRFPGVKKPKELHCTTCDYKSFFPRNFNDHLKIHLPVKERPFICDICGESFTSKTYLDHHQQSKHYQELGKTPFKCIDCGKCFASPQNLKTHIKHTHQKKFKFLCPLCGLGCCSQSTFNLHMKVHSGVKPEKCAECEASFRTNSQLLGHTRRVHRKERPFSCKQCPKKFKESSALHRHVNSVHSQGNNPFKCDLCQKSFRIRNYLYIHMRSHRKKGEISNTKVDTV